MEGFPESVDSKFRFVLLAAGRAEQLMRGARPRVESAGKPTRVAMEEIRNGLVEWGYGQPESVESELLDELAAEVVAEEAEPGPSEDATVA